MSDCGQHLSRLPHRLPTGYAFVCDCCLRAWELRERTGLGQLAFWRRTVDARDGSRVWVRLSRAASLLVQSIQERG
jgi:hypothetical protein